MVITDLPFGKPAVMDDRYCHLVRPGVRAESPSEETEPEEGQPKDSQEYAKFLKEKERKCGPDGFLDSDRYRHSYSVQRQQKKPQDKNGGNQTTRVTVVDLRAKKEKDEKDFTKRLNLIEDHMWQHKQEERELKRIEGDIIKNQRHVRHSLRDYEHAIARKRLSEEKKVNQGLEKYTKIQQEHLHNKEEQTKQRIEGSQTTDQAHKDMGRKVQLTTSHLARQYRTKLSELELKRTEALRISQDYEFRLKQKEEEQFRLKQELAELAIGLNMEAQKGRQQEANFQREKKSDQKVRVEGDRETEQEVQTKIGRGDVDTKAAEQGRRKLSADLQLTRAHLSMKQREESRSKKDTENRLRANITAQKSLNDAAMHAELDLKQKKMDQKLAEYNHRRVQQGSQVQRERKERGEENEEIYSQRFNKRNAEQKRREHEDHLKHFQKSVQKGEEYEYGLYNQVKNTEYTRQKQEQSVRRLQHKLAEVKRQNAMRIKDEMLSSGKAERELQQKLARESAQLSKLHSEREESYQSLQKHRNQLREDRHLLIEHEREHNRLTAISERTDQSVTS